MHREGEREGEIINHTLLDSIVLVPEWHCGSRGQSVREAKPVLWLQSELFYTRVPLFWGSSVIVIGIKLNELYLLSFLFCKNYFLD